MSLLWKHASCYDEDCEFRHDAAVEYWCVDHRVNTAIVSWMMVVVVMVVMVLSCFVCVAHVLTLLFYWLLQQHLRQPWWRWICSPLLDKSRLRLCNSKWDPYPLRQSVSVCVLCCGHPSVCLLLLLPPSSPSSTLVCSWWTVVQLTCLHMADSGDVRARSEEVFWDGVQRWRAADY